MEPIKGPERLTPEVMSKYADAAGGSIAKVIAAVADKVMEEVPMTEELLRALEIAEKTGAPVPEKITIAAAQVTPEEFADMRAALVVFYEVVSKRRHPVRKDDNEEMFR